MTRSRLLAATAAAALLTACGPPPDAETLPDPSTCCAIPPVLLGEHHWHPPNRARLNAWLLEVAATDYEVAPTAAFDWDNTSIFHDIGEATLRFQLEKLRLRLTPDELAAHLPAEVEGVSQALGVSLAAVRADIITAYTALWPHIQADTLEEAYALPEYQDFRAKVAWLYVAMTDDDAIGATFSYPWITGLLAGHTPAEVQAMAAEAVRHAGAEPLAKITWTAANPGEAGALDFTYKGGLCHQPEMSELMRALSEAGVEPFVITASLEYIVEGAAAELGYPVDDDHVFGMRLAQEGDTLTRQMLPGYPITYRAGKVEAIQQHLPAEPILVAGDSNTDFEMLTGFDATDIRIIINRNKSGDIRALYDEALGGSTRTLLQGRDENRCRFRPAQETIPIGAKDPKPL